MTMRRAHGRYALVLLAALALGACSSEPVPELAYYTLPPVTAKAPPGAPRFNVPIAVDAFLADGVYNEQGILYLSQKNRNLRSYHYQLWQDPPTRMLQRRLTDTLRALHLSDLVADRLPSSSDQVAVLGLVRRFDRVEQADGWHAIVQLEMRVERGTGATRISPATWSIRDRERPGALGSGASTPGPAPDGDRAAGVPRGARRAAARGSNTRGPGRGGRPWCHRQPTRLRATCRRISDRPARRTRRPA